LDTIKIFIIDDNPGFIAAAKRYLQTNERVSIIGFAISGKEALEHLKGLEPDVILVDYVMDEFNGIETTKALKRLTPTPKVIMATQHDIPDYKDTAFAAGVDGFVYKSDFGNLIFPLIEKLLNGKNGILNTVQDK
jgi:DNA-binding NarL/FixJ family response regulator